MKPKRSAHDAIVEPSGGVAYDGKAGRTRLERVHLVQQDGSVRSVELYRVANMHTHPELKARILSGQLHRLSDGRELALPFVYHDPGARKFALVIPPVLAHLELKEWSTLMHEIAEDTEHAVPAYVRDSTTVLGIGALELFLEAGIEPDESELSVVEERPSDRARALREREQSIDERERMMREREREVADQERNLVRMAESLTERENSIQRREDQLAAARAELDKGTAERAQVAELAPTSESHAHDAQIVAENAVGEWQEVGVTEAPAISDGERTVVTDLSEVAQQAEMPVDDSEVEEVPSAGGSAAARRSGQPPPLKRSRAPGPPPLRAAAQLSPPPLPAKLPSVRPAARSAPPPPVPIGAAAHAPPPLPAGHGATPSVPPPQPFWELSPEVMAHRVESGELWLYLHETATQRLEAPASAELMLQYCEVEGYPIVLLTLADSVDASKFAARIVLDGKHPGTREVLARLERAFRARVAIFADDRHYKGTHSVSALRETVARAIIDRLARPYAKSELNPVEALRRARQQPPPLSDPELPFGRARVEAATTANVRAAVERLERWMEPDRLEQAMLGYSVPRHVIEASARRVLRAALGYGIALSPRLREYAIEYGVTTDKRRMVSEQVDAFFQRIENRDNDLDEETTHANWLALFAQADELSVEVDPALRRSVEGAKPKRAGASSRPPASRASSIADLRAALQRPEARADAIAELCSRGQASALPAVFEVLDMLTAAEVAPAVAQILSFGEQAGDGLLHGLSSSNQHVRHACALGLGQLKLRRALSSLIKQLEQEPTESWTEIARALGGFGPAALRPVARAIRTSSRRERLMLGLAHLANHGCLFEIESMEKEDDAALALAAKQALARRSRMEWEDRAVRENGTLRDNSPEARFSQTFFAEIAKRAV